MSLRERKFPAVVPNDAHGDMMAFSLPNIETVSDGAYEDALLGWSDAISGAPEQPLRRVPVRVWVEKIKAANAEADVSMEQENVETERGSRNTALLLGVAGVVILAGSAWWRNRKNE